MPVLEPAEEGPTQLCTVPASYRKIPLKMYCARASWRRSNISLHSAGANCRKVPIKMDCARASWRRSHLSLNCAVANWRKVLPPWKCIVQEPAEEGLTQECSVLEPTGERTPWKCTVLHRNKRFTSFPSPAGMSLTKLPLGRNNSVMTSLFPPRESLAVTSRLGTGNSRTFFLRCIAS